MTEYLDREVFPFPTVGVGPMEGEHDLRAIRQRFGGKIDYVHSQASVLCLGFVGRAPAVGAPANHSRSQGLDSQRLARRHSVAFIVEAPHDVGRASLLHQVALNRLRW